MSLVSQCSFGHNSWSSLAFTPAIDRGQYSIYLPVHYRRIKSVILGRYPFLGFFCRLKIVPLDRENGIFNSSSTDVVEKVNIFWWLLHNTGVLRWRRDPHSTWTEMGLFWSLFTGGSFLVDYLKKRNCTI